MYIKKKDHSVGDWVTTTKYHESCNGIFTPGSRVKIIGITERGYNIMDEDDNIMLDIGWIV